MSESEMKYFNICHGYTVLDEYNLLIFGYLIYAIYYLCFVYLAKMPRVINAILTELNKKLIAPKTIEHQAIKVIISKDKNANFPGW